MAIYNGQCGDNMFWELNTEDGIMVISGDGGDMYNYDPHFDGVSPWYNYREQIKTIKFFSVNRIGNCAFEDCKNLRNIWFNDVSYIGGMAFAHCSALEDIFFEWVKQIGMYAFYGCSKLSLIYWGAGLTHIGVGAFQNCSSLKHLTSPDGSYSEYEEDNFISGGIQWIGPESFAGCTSLQYIKLPNSVTNFGSEDAGFIGRVFQNCTSLKRVTLPSNLTQIYEYTFQGCTSLEEVTIPDSITYIGERAFENCESLISINIPERVETIGKRAFAGTGGLTSIYWNIESIDFSPEDCIFDGAGSMALGLDVFVGDNVDRIPNYFMYGEVSDGEFIIPNIANVSISEGVEYIGKYAFYNLIAPTLIIPDSVQTIGSHAFENNHCQEITIGSGVKKIEQNAFGNSVFLQQVHINDLSAWCGILFSGVDANPLSSGASLHMGDSLEPLVTLNIPDDVTEITAYAFCRCNSIETINLENVNVIGYAAFERCKNVQTIRFKSSVKDFHETTRSFEGCGNLTNGLEVIFESTVRHIPANLFNGRINGVTYGAPLLTKLTIHEGVQSIGAYAFAWCLHLTEVHLPNSIISLGNYCFYECEGVETMHLGNKITTIPQGMINTCYRLKEINIPNTVRIIKGDNFVKINNLQKVIIDDVDNWLRISFADETASPWYLNSNTGLYVGEELVTEVRVPNDITTINSYVFHKYTKLKTITFNNTIQRIKANSFTNAGSTYTDGLIAYYLGAEEEKNNVIIEDETLKNCTWYCGFPTDTGWFYIPAEQDNECIMVGYKGTGYDKNNFLIPESIEEQETSLTRQVVGIRPNVLPVDITKVTLPKFLKDITRDVFNELELLNTIVVDDNNNYYCSNNGILYSKDKSVLICFPCNKSASNIKNALVGVTRVGKYAFSGLKSNVAITLNFDINYEEGAFANSNITSVRIESPLNNNDITIPTKMFYNCRKLRIIMIAPNLQTRLTSSLTRISDYAFYNCGYLTEIREEFHLGSNGLDLCDVVYIGNQAFAIEDGFEGQYGIVYFINLHSQVQMLSNSFKNKTVISNKNTIIYFRGTENNFDTVVKDSELKRITRKYYGAINSKDWIVTNYLIKECKNTTLANLVVPSTVKSLHIVGIGASAFQNNSQLTSVSVESNEKFSTIQEYAFEGCENLETVTLPNFMTDIGVSAFANCSKLNQINLPDTITAIGERAFKNTALTRVNLPQNLTIISTELFSGCTNLSDVTFGNVTTIQQKAFYNTGLLQVHISDGLEEIEQEAFANCQQLNSIILPNSTISIKQKAFKDCISLNQIILGTHIQNIGKEAFYNTGYYNNETNWSKYNLNGVLTINDNYLIDVNAKIINENRQINLEHTSLDLKLIASNAFDVNSKSFLTKDNVDEIRLPKSLLYLNSKAIKLINDTEEIYIGGVEHSIGANEVNEKIKVYLTSLNTQYAEDAIIDESVIHLCIRSGSNNTAKDYAQTHFSNSYVILAHILSIDLTTINSDCVIGNYVFKNHNDFTDIKIPKNVISIGQGMLQGCSELTTVQIPFVGENNQSDKPFGWLFNPEGLPHNLNEVTIIGNIDTIYANAFKNTQHLNIISLPNSIKTIGTEAFNNSGIINFTIPIDVEQIGSGAFTNNGNLKTVEWYTTKKEWKTESSYEATDYFDQSFLPTVGTEQRTFGYTYIDNEGKILKSKPNGCVYNSVSGVYTLNGEEVGYAPIFARMIGPDYLSDMSGECGDKLSYTLTNISQEGQIRYKLRITGSGEMSNYIYNSQEQKPETPWSTWRKQIVSVELPSGLTTIGNYAFAELQNATVNLPNTVNSIGEYAFKGCNNVSIETSNTNVVIGNYAFNECSNMNIILPKATTAIGNYAFANGTNLTVTLPDSLQSIGNYSFADNTNLTLKDSSNNTAHILKMNNLMNIGEGAFSGYSQFRRFYWTTSDTSNEITVGKEAFADCIALYQVELPKTKKFSAQSNMFKNCQSISSITLSIPINPECRNIGYLFGSTTSGSNDFYDYTFYAPTGTGSTNFKREMHSIPNALYTSSVVCGDIPLGFFYCSNHIINRIYIDNSVSEISVIRNESGNIISSQDGGRACGSYTRILEFTSNDLDIMKEFGAPIDWFFEKNHGPWEFQQKIENVFYGGIIPSSSLKVNGAKSTKGFGSLVSIEELDLSDCEFAKLDLADFTQEACPKIELLYIPPTVSTICNSKKYNYNSEHDTCVRAILHKKKYNVNVVIDSHTFYYDYVINSINLSYISTIKESAFDNCRNLSFFQSKKSIPMPAAGAFFNCGLNGYTYGTVYIIDDRNNQKDYQVFGGSQIGRIYSCDADTVYESTASNNSRALVLEAAQTPVQCMYLDYNKEYLWNLTLYGNKYDVYITDNNTYTERHSYIPNIYVAAHTGINVGQQITLQGEQSYKINSLQQFKHTYKTYWRQSKGILNGKMSYYSVSSGILTYSNISNKYSVDNDLLEKIPEQAIEFSTGSTYTNEQKKGTIQLNKNTGEIVVTLVDEIASDYFKNGVQIALKETIVNSGSLFAELLNTMREGSQFIVMGTNQIQTITNIDEYYNISFTPGFGVNTTGYQETQLTLADKTLILPNNLRTNEVVMVINKKGNLKIEGQEGNSVNKGVLDEHLLSLVELNQTNFTIGEDVYIIKSIDYINRTIVFENENGEGYVIPKDTTQNIVSVVLNDIVNMADENFDTTDLHLTLNYINIFEVEKIQLYTPALSNETIFGLQEGEELYLITCKETVTPTNYEVTDRSLEKEAILERYSTILTVTSLDDSVPSSVLVEPDTNYYIYSNNIQTPSYYFRTLQKERVSIYLEKEISTLTSVSPETYETQVEKELLSARTEEDAFVLNSSIGLFRAQYKGNISYYTWSLQEKIGDSYVEIDKIVNKYSMNIFYNYYLFKKDTRYRLILTIVTNEGLTVTDAIYINSVQSEDLLLRGVTTEKDCVKQAIKIDLSKVFLEIVDDPVQRNYKICPRSYLKDSSVPYEITHLYIIREDVEDDEYKEVVAQVTGFPTCVYDYSFQRETTYRYSVVPVYQKINEDGTQKQLIMGTPCVSDNDISFDTRVITVVGTEMNLIEEIEETDKLDNNYKVDSNPFNKWYFKYNTEARSVNIITDKTIYEGTTPYATVNSTQRNYKTGVITAFLGAFHKNSQTNEWSYKDSIKLQNKFQEFANNGKIKMLRDEIGNVIPVDITLKSFEYNSQTIPTNITVSFEWTQVGKEKNLTVYEIDE